MPELPEVETVKRGLEPTLLGARIDRVVCNREGLRFPFADDLVEKLQGATITRLERRAKYLLIHLDRDTILISHLGMSGSWHILDDKETPYNKNAVHDHFILEVTTSQGQKALIVYNDPRRFGFLLVISNDDIEQHKLLRDIGPEPLGNAFHSTYLQQALKGKRPLKTALLDQKLVAGLGNIYVCEALWRSGLSPERSADSLAQLGPQKFDALVQAIRAVLQEAIESGGSSLRDYRHTDGSLGYFQHHFSVYGRENEPCPQCGTPIQRITQAGRSTFYCPQCQI